MLKAQQAAVIQEANVNILGIRQAEINYFTQFFSAFGTQSTLLGVMAMACLAQTPGKPKFLLILAEDKFFVL